MEENRVKEHGEEREGLGGVGGSPEVAWRCCLAAMVVKVDPFHFLDDYTILSFFCKF